jgi:predicted nucleotidyltransferase
MKQEEVIQRIKELGEKILPEGASLWLYGSRARGDARPDSDYDLLILLDKDHVSASDYDNYNYPLYDLGLEIGEDISPRIFTKKQWVSWKYDPFYKNVEHDKTIVI